MVNSENDSAPLLGSGMELRTEESGTVPAVLAPALKKEPVHRETAVRLTIPRYEPQTFNNCGPSTLSMLLSYFGIETNQTDLAALLRPWQHPRGVQDDKSLSVREFLYGAGTFGIEGIFRPAGTDDLLKNAVSAGVPVVIRTLLKPGDDIGHYRLVTGYDERKQVYILEDSYYGSGHTLRYKDLDAIWRPFNYQFIVLFREQRKTEIEELLGTLTDETAAWTARSAQSMKEHSENPSDIYAAFNLSSAYYHLGRYDEAVQAFDTIESKLPRRMLWYQIEPVLALAESGNWDRVITVTDRILDSGFRSFSELYHIRSQIYRILGDDKKADEEFSLALTYHRNFHLFLSETELD